jgi:hypothetical protein
LKNLPIKRVKKGRERRKEKEREGSTFGAVIEPTFAREKLKANITSLSTLNSFCILHYQILSSLLYPSSPPSPSLSLSPSPSLTLPLPSLAKINVSQRIRFCLTATL